MAKKNQKHKQLTFENVIVPKDYFPRIVSMLTFILRLHFYKTIKPIHISATSKTINSNYPRVLSIITYKSFHTINSGDLKPPHPNQFPSSSFQLNFKSKICIFPKGLVSEFKEYTVNIVMDVPNTETQQLTKKKWSF